MRKFIWLVLMSLAVTLPALAQFSSSVQGTVTDSTRAVVQGAVVTLVNLDTNVSLTYTTGASGQYHFASLPEGNFAVTVKKSGFQTRRIQARVTTGESAGIDVNLEVAQAASESVTVTDVAPDLNPEETRNEVTIDAEALENLPTQAHSTLNFLKLAPGTTGITENASDTQTNENFVESNANGLYASSNLYILDGVPINASLNTTQAEGNTNGAVMFIPSADSLDELALQTTTFNVEYGNGGSQQISLATKPGSNKFHGSADVTYEDKIFDAVPYNGNAPKAGKHNLWDTFTMGGPVIKNKTFVFGSYERTGTYGGGSGTHYFWAPAFVNYIAQADPNSKDVTGYLVKNPSHFSSATPAATGKDIFGADCGTAKSFNTPCGMTIFENGIVSSPSIQTGHSWSLRGDQNLRGGNDRFFVYYFKMGQTSGSIATVPTWDGSTPTHGDDLTLNYTHIFTSNLLNSATFARTTFGFTFSDTPHSTELLLQPWATVVNGGGPSWGAWTNFAPEVTSEDQYYFRDSLLWTKGTHNFNLGGEYARNHIVDSGLVYARPAAFAFNTVEDFLNDAMTGGETVYLHYNGTNGQFEENNDNAKNSRFGLYAQDQWKIKRNLTVTYGIRWDDLGNPAPASGSIPWGNIFFQSGASTLQQKIAGLNVKTVNNAFGGSKDNNILPRVGFSWSPFPKKASLVLHGGAGLYQDSLQLENMAQFLASNPPNGVLGGYFGQSQAVVSYGNDATKAPYGIAFPTVTINGYNSDGSPIGNPVNAGGFDRNISIPRTLIWNAAVEKELPEHIVAGVTYAGSHSYNQVYQASDLNSPYFSTYKGSASAPVYCHMSDPACVKHTVNANWSQITPVLSGLVANYDAMIAAVRQRIGSLDWQASYTWGHTLNDPNQSSGANNSVIMNPYNPHAGYANADFDIRQRFTGSALYEIPVSHRANGLVREIVGGWNINAIVIGQSGSPDSAYITGGNDVNFTGASTPYYIPNYAGTKRSGWTRAQYKAGVFAKDSTNPLGYAGFSDPAAGVMGTAGRNAFRGPGYFSLDSAVNKKFELPWFGDQKSNLALRGQFFNTLNNTNLFGTGSQVNGSNFGQSTGAFQARTMQIGARFQF
jgi:hypothetical protein